MTTEDHFDVVICGGGLAGLTLARQLRRELPAASIAVVERLARPLPSACFKVGESSVELGSHYFEDVLGLKDYLDEQHLHKNGLRFFTGDTQGPLSGRPEIGPAEFPIVPSFQLDRGKLETDLRGFIEDEGVSLMEGRSVRTFELSDGSGDHRLTLDDGRVLTARWMLDASGRARLISKRLGLRRPSPNAASAAWFRVKGKVRVADLVPEGHTSWHSRDIDGNRWLSTVHLMGKGYWVWIIPLATGYTSIGIVADHENHAFSTYNKEERANVWLMQHEPVLAKHLADLPREDFRVVHNYSYLTERAFDAESRWGCVGEAALFVDPLYSLGSDFVGMANCYATRLVSDDLNGKPLEERRSVEAHLNATLTLLAKDAARTLGGNGKIFPHADIFGAKLWWDFFNYWSFMCAHFFQRLYLCSAAELESFHAMGLRYYELNTKAQAILEGWAELKPDGTASEAAASEATAFKTAKLKTAKLKKDKKEKSFVPLPMFPSVLAKQHLALLERLTPEQTLEKMETDLATGHQLVTEILAHALRDLGPEGAAELGQRIGAKDLALPTEERFAIDSLPRRQRLAKLPEIGRDLERALGRKSASAPLNSLWKAARGVA